MNAPLKHTADATTVEEGLAIQEAQSKLDSVSATDVAMQNTLLTPRFYTTDFDEMDAVDVSPVRKDWDALIAQMKADPNHGHFKKNEDWNHIDWDGMDPELRKEFIDFLISSCTSEFSGCVLYKEMKRRGNNADITALFQLMARGAACGLHQRCPARGRRGGEPRISHPEEEVHPLPAEIHLQRHLFQRKDRLCPLHHRLPASRGASRTPVPPDLQVVPRVVQRRVPPRRGLRC